MTAGVAPLNPPLSDWPDAVGDSVTIDVTRPGGGGMMTRTVSVSDAETPFVSVTVNVTV